MTDRGVNLWSALVVSETMYQIQCPPGLYVSVDEFAAALQRRIEGNQIDAFVDLQHVSWDDEAQSSTKILVKPGKAKAYSDVLCLLVDLSSEGIFAHLDEKLMLMPPPAVREKRPLLPYQEFEPTEEGDRIGGGVMLGIGLVLLPVGLVMLQSGWGGGGTLLFLAVLFGVCGGIVLYSCIRQKRKNGIQAKLVDADNAILRDRNAQVKAWNAEVERDLGRLRSWAAKTDQLVLTRRRDNSAGKWASAVSSTIQQVVDEMYYANQARLQGHTHRERTDEEIAAHLEKRHPEAYDLAFTAFGS